MPTFKSAHINQALTDISVAYIQDESNFIATKVFPQVPVKQQSNLYYKYNKGDFFRNEMKERAGGTESAGGRYAVAVSEPYYCVKKAVHIDVTEEERVNYDKPLDADTDAVIFVTQKALLEREVTWAKTYFKPDVWSTEFTGVATLEEVNAKEKKVLKWSNPLSNPIEDVTNAGIELTSQTGKRPNKLVLAPRVFNALKNHEDIIDRIKYTQKGIVTADLLATLFEVEEVLIAWAVVNDANKGEEDNIDFILGNHALLIYAAPSPSLRTPSAGYIFSWTGLLGASAYGNRLIRLPMDNLGIGTERTEIELAYDAKIVSQDLGLLFKDIV